MSRRRKSDEFAGREEAAGLGDQAAASEATPDGTPTGNGTSPQLAGLQRWRESGGRKGKITYASFLVFGIRQDGSQVLIHTAANRYRCAKWLVMAAEIIRDNYAGITIIKGRDVTPLFVDQPPPEAA